MWQRFTLPARNAILRGQQLAGQNRDANVSPAHLFLGLMDEATPDSPLGALLLRLGWKAEEARLYVAATIAPMPPDAPLLEPKLTAGGKRILEMAADEARRAGDNHIGTEHLLLACLRLQSSESVRSTLETLGWDLETLRARRREARQRQTESAPTDDAKSAPLSRRPLESLSVGAQRAIDAAYAAMRATYCGRISTAHLLLGLLSLDCHARELLEEVGVSPDELKARTRASVRADNELATPDKRFDRGAKRALDRARHEAQSRGAKVIGTEHILLGLLPRRATTREFLTWGRDVPDEAARVLANVDGAKLGELVGPKVKVAAKPTPKKTTRDVPALYAKRAFAVAFVVEFNLSLLLTRVGVSPLLLLGRLGALCFVLVLVAAGLGACWMLLLSRKPNLKSAWVRAFAGALFGALASLLLHS